jgi:hypothetical protein
MYRAERQIQRGKSMGLEELFELFQAEQGKKVVAIYALCRKGNKYFS